FVVSLFDLYFSFFFYFFFTVYYCFFFFFFFFNDTATTEIYTLSPTRRSSDPRPRPCAGARLRLREAQAQDRRLRDRGGCGRPDDGWGPRGVLLDRPHQRRRN